MHGRGGKDVYIDIPVGTAVYKLTLASQSGDEELKRSFDEQMYSHLGKLFNTIKDAEDREEMPENAEVKKELLFDSSFSKNHDVYCVAHGGIGGQGNHEWYEQSKQRNLRNWGSNRDRRLQATYYKVR